MENNLNIKENDIVEAVEPTEEFDSNKVVELNIIDVVNLFKTMQEGYNVLAELISARVVMLSEMSEYILPSKFIKMSKKANGLIINITSNMDRLNLLDIRIPALEEEYSKYVEIVADESKTELEKDLAMAKSIDEFNSLTKELYELNNELENLTEVYTIFVQNEIDLELRSTVKAKELLLENKEKLESEFEGEWYGKHWR